MEKIYKDLRAIEDQLTEHLTAAEAAPFYRAFGNLYQVIRKELQKK